MAYGDAYNYLHIPTATTTTVKTGTGVLHSITVGAKGLGAYVVYDNTAGSGTKIADNLGSTVETTDVYDVAFTTGLTIVTAGASKLTVTYR